MIRDVSGLYLHIPFCRSKCHYCDFVSLVCPDPGQKQRYVGALLAELDRKKHRVTAPLTSLYLGGGTPSVLPDALLETLLEGVRARLPFAPDAEVTMEVNPGTADARRMARFRAAGITRLSLGIQSFQDRELAVLGRAHDARTAWQAVQDALTHGPDRVSLDLIAGIPGQTPESFAGTLRQAVSCPLGHLSVYDLQVEAGTPLAGRIHSGLLSLPGEEEGARIDQLRGEILAEAGFVRYEISNYCRDGDISRHNMLYWQNGGYLGLGAGAVSRWGRVRLQNTRWLAEYCDTVLSGDPPPGTREHIGERQEREETVFLALRTGRGLDLSGFASRHGQTLQSQFGAECGDLVSQGLAEYAGGRFFLTGRGMQMSNCVLARFV